MENKKEKLEDFKTAISSTVRSLSNSQEIEISFGNQVIKSSKNSRDPIIVSFFDGINSSILLISLILHLRIL